MKKLYLILTFALGLTSSVMASDQRESNPWEKEQAKMGLKQMKNRAALLQSLLVEGGLSNRYHVQQTFKLTALLQKIRQQQAK